MISTKVTAVLRRRWPILAIAFAIGVLAGAVSSQLAPSDIVQQYRAEQVVVANSTGTGGVSVQQDSLKVTRGEIPTIAAEAMGGGERGDRLAADMSVTVDTESQAITIASVDVNPDVAAQRVNAVTTAFLDVTNGQRQEAERVRVEQLGAAAKAAEEDLATFDETYPDLVDPRPVRKRQCRRLSWPRPSLTNRSASSNPNGTSGGRSRCPTACHCGRHFWVCSVCCSG